MLVEPDVPLSAPYRKFLSHHSQSQLILLDTDGQTWTFPSASLVWKPCTNTGTLRAAGTGLGEPSLLAGIPGRLPAEEQHLIWLSDLKMGRISFVITSAFVF